MSETEKTTEPSEVEPKHRFLIRIVISAAPLALFLMAISVSLTAAWSDSMAWAFVWLLIAWIVATAGTYATEPEWDIAGKNRVGVTLGIGVLSFVICAGVGVYDYHRLSTKEQSSGTISTNGPNSVGQQNAQTIQNNFASPASAPPPAQHQPQPEASIPPGCAVVITGSASNVNVDGASFIGQDNAVCASGNARDISAKNAIIIGKDSPGSHEYIKNYKSSEFENLSDAEFSTLTYNFIIELENFDNDLVADTDSLSRKQSSEMINQWPVFDSQQKKEFMQKNSNEYIDMMKRKSKEFSLKYRDRTIKFRNELLNRLNMPIPGPNNTENNDIGDIGLLFSNVSHVELSAITHRLSILRDQLSATNLPGQPQPTQSRPQPPAKK